MMILVINRMSSSQLFLGGGSVKSENFEKLQGMKKAEVVTLSITMVQGSTELYTGKKKGVGWATGR